MTSFAEQFSPGITPEELGHELDKPGSKRGLYALLACAAIGIGSWAGFATAENDSPHTKLRGPVPVAPASSVYEASTTTTEPMDPCIQELTARKQSMTGSEIYMAALACQQESIQGGGLVDPKN